MKWRDSVAGCDLTFPFWSEMMDKLQDKNKAILGGVLGKTLVDYTSESHVWIGVSEDLKFGLSRLISQCP